MSLTLPASTNIASIALDFIQGLFSRPSPAAIRKANAGDVWALYSMSRGRDSVSPAVLSKLADHAA